MEAAKLLACGHIETRGRGHECVVEVLASRLCRLPVRYRDALQPATVQGTHQGLLGSDNSIASALREIGGARQETNRPVAVAITKPPETVSFCWSWILPTCFFVTVNVPLKRKQQWKSPTCFGRPFGSNGTGCFRLIPPCDQFQGYRCLCICTGIAHHPLTTHTSAAYQDTQVESEPMYDWFISVEAGSVRRACAALLM